MTNNSKTISIIILTYNGRNILPLCLPSIVKAAKKSPLPCDIILLDNKSTDNSMDYVSENFKDVKIISANKNDVLYSYNDIFNKISSDILILLNDDVKVDENFIEPMIGYFENKNVFAVLSKQMNFNGTRRLGCPNKGWVEFGTFKVGRIYKRGEEEDISRFTLYGFNGAFDRKKILELGGFDPLYKPFTWEDSDLCYRAWKRGWASICEVKSVIFHDESHTIDREHKLKKMRGGRILTRRNSILFFWKNISSPGLILKYLAFQLPKLFSALINDWAYVAAFFESFLKLPSALIKRKSEEKKRILSDQQIFNLVNQKDINLESLKQNPEIGIVTTWYNRGVSYQSKFLAQALSGKNDIYIFAHKKMIKDNGFRAYKKLIFKRNPSPKHIISWIKNNKLKIVFFPDRLESPEVLDWCKENNVKTVMIINYETIKKEEFGHYKKYFKILCPVKCTYDLLKENNIQNIGHIQWAIDTKTYAPVNTETKEPIRFIHNAGFGGAQNRKNTEAVVKAFDIASKTNKNIRLILKSQKPLKEYPAIISAICNSNPQIIIEERNLKLEDLLNLYRSCHVSLLPSKWEGIGLPFLESLSMGLPVITVNAPPMNEWVKAGQNGFLAEAANFDLIKESILSKAAVVNIDNFSEQILRLSEIKLIEKLKQNAIMGMKAAESKFKEEINSFVDSLLENN